MQTSTVYLAGRLGDMSQPQSLVGQPVLLQAPAGKGPLVVKGPDGRQTAVSADGRGRARFGKTHRAGHYKLLREQAPDLNVPFSVNADRSESDLRRANLAQVQDVLNTPGTADAPRGKIEGRPGSEAPDPFRSNLWPIVLVALFGLLFAETWVVIRGVR